MKNDYFHRVAALTPTKMWINNVTPPEAEWAIDAGAMGCTQNPSYTWKMLNHPDYKDDALTLLDETLKETDDDNQRHCTRDQGQPKDIANLRSEDHDHGGGE